MIYCSSDLLSVASRTLLPKGIVWPLEAPEPDHWILQQGRWRQHSLPLKGALSRQGCSLCVHPDSMLPSSPVIQVVSQAIFGGICQSFWFYASHTKALEKGLTMALVEIKGLDTPYKQILTQCKCSMKCFLVFPSLQIQACLISLDMLSLQAIASWDVRLKSILLWNTSYAADDKCKTDD